MEETGLYVEVTIIDVIPFLSAITLISTIDSNIPFTFSGSGLTSTVVTKKLKRKDTVCFVRLRCPRAELTNYSLYDESSGSAERVFDDSKKFTFKIDKSVWNEKLKGIKPRDILTIHTEANKPNVFYRINNIGNNIMTPVFDVVGKDVEFPRISIDRESPIFSISKEEYVSLRSELSRLKKDAELKVIVYASGVLFQWRNYGTVEWIENPYGNKDVRMFEIKLETQSIIFPASRMAKMCPDKALIKFYAEMIGETPIFLITIPVGVTEILDILCGPSSLID